MKVTLTHKENVISWIAQIIAALIMLQTLFFKFSGAEESVYIFSTVHMEPWGRYMTGTAELLASILLLIPTLAWAGAILGIGIMTGAIICHLTILGISVMNDSGYLFFLALLTFVACFVVVIVRRCQVPYLKKYFI